MIDIMPPVNQYLAAFAHGLDQHGVKYTYTDSPRGQCVVGWGWRKLRAHRARGANVLVVERGYVGDRTQWTSLGWNGLNNRADFCNANVTKNRWEKLFKNHMRDWRTGGKYILLCGQVPRDMALMGKDINAMYPKLADTLARFYDMPVIFRPHPEAVRKEKGYAQLKGYETSVGPIEGAIDGAALVWSYNSNSGVDGVMRGCPTAALDHGAMAWDVATRGIGEIKRPCREEWGRKIAYTQWNLQEIASGRAWEHIGVKYRENI
jgi:hypothetical protein